MSLGISCSFFIMLPSSLRKCLAFLRAKPPPFEKEQGTWEFRVGRVEMCKQVSLTALQLIRYIYD